MLNKVKSTLRFYITKLIMAVRPRSRNRSSAKLRYKLLWILVVVALCWFLLMITYLIDVGFDQDIGDHPKGRHKRNANDKLDLNVFYSNNSQYDNFAGDNALETDKDYQVELGKKPDKHKQDKQYREKHPKNIDLPDSSNKKVKENKDNKHRKSNVHKKDDILKFKRGRVKDANNLVHSGKQRLNKKKTADDLVDSGKRKINKRKSFNDTNLFNHIFSPDTLNKGNLKKKQNTNEQNKPKEKQKRFGEKLANFLGLGNNKGSEEHQQKKGGSQKNKNKKKYNRELEVVQDFPAIKFQQNGNKKNVHIKSMEDPKNHQGFNPKLSTLPSRDVAEPGIKAARAKPENSTNKKGTYPWIPGKKNNLQLRFRRMTPDEKLDMEKGTERHSFNVKASEKIGLYRDVPDHRPQSCPHHFDTDTLPKVSIIMCFHNEAWSTLLRSLHSIMSTTPPRMLHEIILVDDKSSYDYLGSKLENHLSKYSKIKLLRTAQREGLIRARLLGVQRAEADVLVFLDSHVECNNQWLEPLVTAIQRDSSKIACPQIDIINDKTFEYTGATEDLQGGFDWTMQFLWKPISEKDQMLRKSPSDPIRTPTMIGGLFAVNKKFFKTIGQYDSGMEIWGGENIELSFRTWMCGGSIEILPCSRVGHVFRPIIPYTFPKGAKKTVKINSLRVMETWLDDYKKLYYAQVINSQSPKRDPKMAGAVTQMTQLRQKLKCHDFKWYLNNVVPDLVIPPDTTRWYGQISLPNTKICLDASDPGAFKLAECVNWKRGQVFYMTKEGRLVVQNKCVAFYPNVLHLKPCSQDKSIWTYNAVDKVLAGVSVIGNKLCATKMPRNKVIMDDCRDQMRPWQIWQFSINYKPQLLKQSYT